MPERPGLSRTQPSEPKASILMVDDSPANLLSLRAILEDLGHNFIEARSGEEALEQVKSEEFAVVLLDVWMPGMSGFETAKRLRDTERSRHTPIIFLTANDIDRPQLEEAYALGAVDLLVKPLMPVILQSKVREFVQLFKDKQRSARQADLLRLLVHGTTEYAIFMLDPEGYVVTWNTGAERLKGYKAEEITGQHFSVFYPQEATDRAWPQYELQMARQTGRFEDEGWRVRKDRSQFWANVVITALYDEAGRLRGFSKITRDMTERKRAEDNARRLVEETTARRVAEENARVIQEQRERLHVTLASIGDGVISTDAEGRVTFLNPVAQELVGWMTTDAVSQTLTDVFHIVNEETRLPVENPAMRALRDGKIVGLANHTVLISRNGSERPIDDSAAPIRDADGNVVGSILVFRDITDRKRAEEHRNIRLGVTHALSEASSIKDGASGVLRAVCENLGWDVGFFWTVNQPRTELQCTISWRIPGVPVEEFEQLSCSSTFTKGEGLPGCVWVSGKPAWMLNIGRDESFPRLVSAVQHDLHSALACPIVVGDQTLGVIEFFSKAIREPDPELLEMMGTIAGSVGQFIERKAAEEELRRSEQELADFFENASVGLHWVGPDGVILRANQAELDILGYSKEEYVGRPIADFHVDQDAICDILNRLLAGEKLSEYPARLRCRNGSIKDVLIDSSGLFRDGRFVHTRCFTRDVTESRRAEAALREADRRKDEFLATLAHELRNPLAPLRNALQILKMPKVDAATVELSREMMERQVQHLVRLVDDLLDVSRVMRGKIVLRKEPVELTSIMTRAVETAQPLIDSQQHELIIELPRGSLLLDADPVRLGQVISNLLTNSAKYTEPNGHIWLTARQEGNHAVLRVRDDGIGIAPDMLPHVFELFVQADHASTRTQGGLGIGLTLVKSLVEMHHGSVEAQSAGLGKGCEFVVRFPVLAQSTPSNGEKTEQESPRPIAGHRLLIVDDNEDAAISLAMLLRLQGHDVRVAHSGAVALDIAASFRPDVIFLDIGMPGMDGYEVARRVRQTPGLEKTVLAALTGWGQQEDRRRTSQAGFDHHLVKPPEPKEVEGLLAKVRASKS